MRPLQTLLPILKDDCMADAAILATKTMNKSMIAEKGDDTEFELDDFEKR